MTLRSYGLLALTIGAGLAAALLLSTCTTTGPAEEPAGPVLSQGGTVLDLAVKDRFHFLQRDPKWVDAKMGASGGTIGDYGCTLTAVSMALANLGVDTDPGRLNKAVSKIDGYTPRGWIKWRAVEQAAGDRVQVTIYGPPSAAQIDHCLRDRHYPIVKFMLEDRVQHWALVVGKSGEDWMVRDPLDPTLSRRPLKELTSAVESVRCIRPAER